MKKNILILAVALVVAATSATAQNQVDRQGRRQGHWLRTDKDGSKIYEGDFVDGLETGIFTYYYPNGTVRMRNTYSVPGRVCSHEAYDEQGNLLATGSYNQRNRDGEWRFYAEGKRLVKIANYSMGVKDGLHIIFDRNGETAEVAGWANNHRHGRWWKRIGTKGYITGNYVHGNLEGRLVEYNKDGRLALEADYLGGLRHGESRRYEDGTLTVRERWTNGIMDDREILLHCPEPRFVSIHDIACLAALGKAKTVVTLYSGGKLTAHDDWDHVFSRAGNELFALANREQHIYVATLSIKALGKDSDGRDILLLDPQPDFVIFPDEDGIRMVQSTLRDNTRKNTVDDND